MNELFPIFLKAHQIPILIIGGGEVAAEKLKFLIKSSPNAKVTLVAKEIAPITQQFLQRNPSIQFHNRWFKKEDLYEKKIVIAATNNQGLNLELSVYSKKLNFLLNVADQPQFCDFYLGGIVTKKNLKIAISSNGKSPILTKRLREFFEENLPNEIDSSIEKMEVFRKMLTGEFNEKLKVLSEMTENLINKN